MALKNVIPPTTPITPGKATPATASTAAPTVRRTKKVIPNKPSYPPRPIGSDALTKQVRKPNLGGKPVSAPTPISGTANARKPGAEIPAPVKPKTQKQSTDPWKTGW